MEIITSLRSFWALLDQNRKTHFFVLAGSMAFLAMLEAAAPLLIAAYFKPELLFKILYNGTESKLDIGSVEGLQRMLPWIIVLIFSLKTGFGFFMSSRVNRFCFELQANIGKRVLAAYLNMPFDVFRAIKSGDILRNVLNEPSQVTFNISLPLLLFVTESLVLIAMLLVALYISPVAIITITIVFAIVIYMTHLYTSSRISVYSKTRHDEDASRMLLVNNSILGFLDIRFGQSASLTCDEYHRHADRSASAEAAQQTIASIPRYSLELSLVFLLLLVISSDIAIADSLHIATAFLAIGYRLLPTLNRLTTALQLFKYGFPAINSLFKIIISNRDESEEKFSLHYNELQSINLQSVVKKRPDTDQLLFPALNLILEKGIMYAISGPSGVGKSTLLHIISGMLPTDSGKVTYNTAGGLIEDRKKFYPYVAYLDQSPYVAETFLSNNLLLSNSEMRSRNDVIHYFNEVGLNNLSDAICRGEDPLLGRGGIHLSGGEKQRFALVRALLQNKPVLLLDEPTAGLDQYSEQKFIELCRKVRSGYIIVLISHSKNVVESADNVIELQ